MPVDPFVEMIPLSKLVPSPANVRKTGRDLGIEELAASIAAHGLLQNLTVRPVLDAERNETGKYEVVAGSRRFAALKLLAKRKVILKNYPVPCALVTAFSGEEVSLAENMFQSPMHPADQYEAFVKLHGQEGHSAEDIAARFGVTPAVVRQRLRLGAVSPVLMNFYREGEMTLEQLMAFTITDDHALQERVWKELTWNKSKEMIRRLLVEGHVEASDRRARYIGVDAYQAAGGHIVRDLFDAEHEGYFDDPELLNRLVAEKLDREADPVRAEGWKWVMVAPEFHYSAAAGMRRVFPETVPLSDEDQAKLDALESKHEALSIQHADENLTDELAAEFERLETAIEALRPERYRSEDIAICGAFVSLTQDGRLRVERGFLRPEDEPTREAEKEAPEYEGKEDVSSKSDASDDDGGEQVATLLSDRLVAELTAERTAALRDRLSANPDVALLALTHALASQTFYRRSGASCLTIEVTSVPLHEHAPDVTNSPAIEGLAARTADWAKRLPRDIAPLWDYLAGLDREQLLPLLAVCVAPAVNALRLPHERQEARHEGADTLATALSLDMTHYWSPTAASYFGRVTKVQILEAVREGASPDAAERLSGMKKEPMAKAAETLLKDRVWLPPVRRRRSTEPEVFAIAAE